MRHQQSLVTSENLGLGSSHRYPDTFCSDWSPLFGLLICKSDSVFSPVALQHCPASGWGCIPVLGMAWTLCSSQSMTASLALDYGSSFSPALRRPLFAWDVAANLSGPVVSSWKGAKSYSVFLPAPDKIGMCGNPNTIWRDMKSWLVGKI